MYYEDETGYYDPSDADIFFDEMKEKFREYLTDDVKNKIVGVWCDGYIFTKIACSHNFRYRDK